MEGMCLTGALPSMMALMEKGEGKKGDTTVCFCMAAALAGLILDEEAMQIVVERKEAAPLFENCVALLAQTLESLDSSETQVLCCAVLYVAPRNVLQF